MNDRKTVKHFILGCIVNVLLHHHGRSHEASHDHDVYHLVHDDNPELWDKIIKLGEEEKWEEMEEAVKSWDMDEHNTHGSKIN